MYQQLPQLLIKSCLCPVGSLIYAVVIGYHEIIEDSSDDCCINLGRVCCFMPFISRGPKTMALFSIRPNWWQVNSRKMTARQDGLLLLLLQGILFDTVAIARHQTEAQKYLSCDSCIAAGFGWQIRTNRCGKFKNKQCPACWLTADEKEIIWNIKTWRLGIGLATNDAQNLPVVSTILRSEAHERAGGRIHYEVNECPLMRTGLAILEISVRSCSIRVEKTSRRPHRTIRFCVSVLIPLCKRILVFNAINLCTMPHKVQMFTFSISKRRRSREK
eukprot:SAG31_NODE_2042_length_6589_cov_10.177504_2_plen_274_part_00